MTPVLPPARELPADPGHRAVPGQAAVSGLPAVPVLPALRIGRHTIGSPVVLAPMAGITNRAFRRLCREYGDAGQGHADAPGASRSGASTPCASAPGASASRAGVNQSLYVSEMVTSRALVERTPRSMQLIEHDPDETLRSIQLYGVDPATVGAAVRMLVSEDRADHIDLNFGCPVPKVTRRGGGAALPWKTDLFRAIVSQAVKQAAPYDVPVTVKMRMGIDSDHLTFLEAGRIAETEGVAAVALHARTAAQAYSGQADWAAIKALKEVVTSIPVLGNGDIWSAQDALDMVAATGCDGVVVGRGCLGRPWLFTDLAAAFAGTTERVRPNLGQVAETLRLHTEYLADFLGSEFKACRDIRKHIAWYLKGFPAGHDVRRRLALVDSMAALDELIAMLDPTAPWPGDPAEGQRGRAGSPRRVNLPAGWLDSRELNEASAAAVAEAELSVSGG